MRSRPDSTSPSVSPLDNAFTPVYLAYLREHEEVLTASEAEMAGPLKILWKSSGGKGKARPILGRSCPILGKASPTFGKSSPILGESSTILGKSPPIGGESSPKTRKSSPISGKSRPTSGKASRKLGRRRPIFGKSSRFGGRIPPGFGEVLPASAEWGSAPERHPRSRKPTCNAGRPSDGLPKVARPALLLQALSCGDGVRYRHERTYRLGFYDLGRHRERLLHSRRRVVVRVARLVGVDHAHTAPDERHRRARDRAYRGRGGVDRERDGQA